MIPDWQPRCQQCSRVLGTIVEEDGQQRCKMAKGEGTHFFNTIENKDGTFSYNKEGSFWLCREHAG